MENEVKQKSFKSANHLFTQIFSLFIILFFAVLTYLSKISSDTLVLIVFVLVSIGGIEINQAKKGSFLSKWIFSILMMISLIIAVLAML